MTKKTIAIMQPTYLPWPGFFELIAQSHTFVFLDDAKLEKSSWHVRNRFLINQAGRYLTVELNSGRLSLIKDAKLADTNWREKHAQSLRNAYGKSPFGEEVLGIVLPIIESGQQRTLADINIELIVCLCQHLEIETNLIRASELGVPGRKSERLIEMCRRLDADHYYSPAGSRDYIEEEGLFPDSGLTLTYQEFPSSAYSQFNSNEFVPYLSIVDLLANVGKRRSLAYIKRSDPS